MIVTAPCCHKQLRPQVDRPAPTPRHRIHMSVHTSHASHLLFRPTPQVDRHANAAALADTSPAQHALLRHGIFRERESEMVTDALRALALQVIR